MGSTKLILILVQEKNDHKGALCTFVLIMQFAFELDF